MGCLSVDGTKVKANASKHKAMRYERGRGHEDAGQAGGQTAGGRGLPVSHVGAPPSWLVFVTLGDAFVSTWRLTAAVMLYA